MLTKPNSDVAQAVPSLPYILATKRGKPAPKRARTMLLDAMALLQTCKYTSIKYVIQVMKTRNIPVPTRTPEKTTDGQRMLGVAVHAYQKSPGGIRKAPPIIRGSRSSGLTSPWRAATLHAKVVRVYVQVIIMAMMMPALRLSKGRPARP